MAKTARDMEQAYAEGCYEDRNIAQGRYYDYSNKLNVIDQASRVGGAGAGRALRSFRLEMNYDYSFDKMRSDLSAAKGGEPLSPEEISKLQEMADKYKKLLEDIAKREEQVAEQQSVEGITGDIVKIKEEIQRDHNSGKKAPDNKTFEQLRDELIAKAKNKI